MAGSILIVEDNDTIREGMAHVLQRNGYRIVEARSGIEGYEVYKKFGPWDLVITDLKMDGLNGFQLIKKIRAEKSDMKFLMVSAYGTIERAVEAIKIGASDFVTKPFDKDAFIEKVKAVLGGEVATEDETTPLVRAKVLLSSKSPRYLSFLDDLSKRCSRGGVLLIRAEPGTYVQEVCRAICVKNGGKQFNDCSHLPVDSCGQEGVCPANGRSAVCYRSFSKLSDKEMDLVEGASKRNSIGLMIISFRQGVLERPRDSIAMPSLADRKEDIGDLAEHTLFQVKNLRGRSLSFSPEALAWISRCSWPGNLAELESFLIKLSDDKSDGGSIGIEDLERAMETHLREGFFRMGIDVENCSLSDALDGVERRLIVDAFEKAGRVKTETARILGIKTSALYYKLEKYGLL